MSLRCYLLDENVDPGVRSALHRVQPELAVWIVGDPGAPGLGRSDPDILKWCEAHGFSLVTHNRSTLPRHLEDHLDAGGHVPGIFFLHPDLPIGETANDLLLISEATEPDEFRDQVVYLPI